MPTEFESGAREEIRWVELADQHDTSAVADFTVLPHGGNPKGPNKPYSRGPSDEVTSDLTPADNPARSFTVPMGLSNVVRYGCHDLPMQQVLNNHWASPFTTGSVTTISTAAVGNKFIAASGTPFATLADVVPCPIWICRGGSNPIPGQPVIAKAVLASGTELQIETDANNGKTLTLVSAGDPVVIMHSGVLFNGTDLIFAMIERAQKGIVNFRVGHGMLGTQMAFSGTKGSDPTWSFEWMGLDYDRANTTFGTGTETQAPGWQGFNMGSNFKYARMGGVAEPNLFFHKVDYTIAGGATPVDPAGIDGPYAHQKQQFKVSGSLEFFSNDEAQVVGDVAAAGGEMSLFFGLFRTQGGVTRGYQKWIPRCQFESEDQDGGGNDNTLTQPMNWMAARDPNYGNRLFCMTRFTGVPLTL